MNMEQDFETLIASFIKNNVGISEHFLSDALANNLKLNLFALHKQKLLLAAATGNANNLSHDTAIRSDSIYWLDRKHDNKYENEFFDLIEDFIKYLNKSCYAGIASYEFHYSLYETGSFYKKHLDQFQNKLLKQQLAGRRWWSTIDPSNRQRPKSISYSRQDGFL